MIINIRGTGGSGKSTVVTRITELYTGHDAQFQDGRKRPLWMHHTRAGDNPPLVVPGHYETACGGCDTIKTVDAVYNIVRHARMLGCDVLYEGIMVMDDVTRAVKLSQEVGRQSFCVIGLTTDIDDCLRAIEDRRRVRGDDRPLDPKNTRSRAERCVRGLDRLRNAGVRVERRDREGAFQLCRELLNV